ncbi:2Fe-2S iron-sulfur cluster-binding protein [Flavobacteriaceae bacterium]|jgi:ring-1,2-phenylacetyl-CoA epoxidase subunit PaaE|nr:2Fe-2S iron-sulfur cluster-binding protein [Flavobacteriaceae bacterium]MDA7724006.1 2Fe-2S iron-sulfur cluster-binding protein [Flavobacteriaceae bacterium]MDA7728417.1 2Fe-2S iron-sulfur cluster-binding protein [Flavobacteriaceae bacterium]
MAQFHSLKIKSILRQTDKAVSITFEVPTALNADFAFTAGQYITLKTVIDAKEIRRDYSLSSSPQSESLTVTVKEIENGVFSSYANTQLKTGDTLEVGTPNGRFIYDPKTDASNTIVAFAAGSGITPIMSIARTVLETDSNFVLIYGNKSPKETIFYDEILKLQILHSNRFMVLFIYSETDEKDALFGRIDSGNVQYLLKNNIAVNNSQKFYLCGPEGMINTVNGILTEKGVEASKVLFELFTASEVKSTSTSTNEGDSNITILVDEEETTLVMSQKQTILEAALANDLDVPYSCQGGVCSSCICRVTEGTATMRQNNILTDNEVAEGLVLSCQAEPTSTSINVDFDDI